MTDTSKHTGPQWRKLYNTEGEWIGVETEEIMPRKEMERRWPMTKGTQSEQRCVADKNCPMTADYYIGGGLYICWLHALTVQEIEQALEQAKRNRATQENDCSRAYRDLRDAQQDYEDEKQLLSLKKSEVEEWEQRLTQAKEALHGKPE